MGCPTILCNSPGSDFIADVGSEGGASYDSFTSSILDVDIPVIHLGELIHLICLVMEENSSLEGLEV